MDAQTMFWIIFAIVMVIIGVGSPFYGSWLIRKISGVTGPIEGGLPGSAVVQSITDTGTTVTMPSVGPDAPEYKLGLLVTPAGGGTPYQVETKTFVPRVFIPMMVPGATFAVQIDPKDPRKVSVDFSQEGGQFAAPAFAGAQAVQMGQAGAVNLGSMNFQFDANGRPTGDELSAVVGAVRGGSMPTINSSADQLLATGTHGTAVITSCQPMGKKVRDLKPDAPADRLDDPMWVFTVEVKLPGQSPFPAVFGHRVPVSKVTALEPGARLAVSVDEANKNQDVAIDWNQSPMIGG
jgi:hypothetical protein